MAKIGSKRWHKERKLRMAVSMLASCIDSDQFNSTDLNWVCLLLKEAYDELHDDPATARIIVMFDPSEKDGESDD